MFNPLTSLPFILLVLIAVCLLVFYKKILKFFNRYKYLYKLPAPPAKNRLLGNALNCPITPENIFILLRQWGLGYYPIYRAWLLCFWGACIVSPEDFELILSNTKHNSKSHLYTLLHSWLGTGLLTSNDEKWQVRRKMLTPTFHFNILKQFMVIFNEETRNLVEMLKEKSQVRPEIEIDPIISQYTLQTITETAMGIKLDFKSKKGHEYKQAILDLGNLLFHRLFRPWRIYLLHLLPLWCGAEYKFLQILHGFTRSVIQERKQNFQQITVTQIQDDYDEEYVYSKKKRLAMLDLLLSIQNEDGTIDDEGIREEVDTFMFEGHDTTTAAICFSLLMIANHRDVQEKIIDEMRTVLGDIRRQPTLNELSNLKYLECCIKETLRLYPSVHFISRRLGEDIVTHSGYKLIEGTWVYMHIYDLHHNPNIYPDPERFDPDRFLPENIQKRHPFAYVPFSAGSRNCIGQRYAMMELKVALCGILGNFVLEPIDTAKDTVLSLSFILKPTKPIKIRFVPRIE